MDGIAIKDGKVDGNNVSFSVSLDFGGMPFTLTHKGVVAKDQIKLTGDAMGMPFEMVVKKTSHVGGLSTGLATAPHEDREFL